MSKFDEIRKKALQKAKGEAVAEEVENEDVEIEETSPESSEVEDVLPVDVEAAPVEETEEVPDENVENLDDSEAGEEDTTLPQSPDGDSSLGERANVDIDAVIVENKALKEEIESLRKTLEESSELAKESTVAVATGDLGDVDFSAFMYGDDEAKKCATGKLIAYLMEALKTEAAPVLKERDEANRALAVQRAIKALSAMEDMFPGFGKEADAIEALIGRDNVLASYEDPMQARIAGYLINKGLKAVEKDKTGMSIDELMDLYRKNEEFKATVEKERLQLLEETGNIPVIPMDGGGLSTAAPYEAPEPPKSVKEATERAKKRFLK